MGYLKTGYRLLSGKFLVYSIIALGILLRIAECLHARDLMMDEVNVVRNVYERNFAALFGPLDYEQFAPPLFLCAIKTATLFGGYGELSLRIFPLICSCLSLVAFYKLIINNGLQKGAWYVLSILSFSLIYIHYTNAVKQYSSDALLSILILLFALKHLNSECSNKYFFAFWTIFGSFVIWTSMPSVFLLSGAGLSFLAAAIRRKNYYKLRAISGVGVVWIVVFLSYYFMILRNQISSDYLRSFHDPYFLKIHSVSDLFNSHNTWLISEVFAAGTGTKIAFIFYFNVLLFVAGLVLLFKKGLAYGLLLSVPVLGLIVASALQQFTLLPRVCIFIMPVVLFIIGYGFSSIISLLRWYSIPLVIIGVIGVYYAQQLHLFLKKNRIEIDELNTEVNFALNHNVRYDQMYLHPLYTPNLIYYQSIHPDRERGAKYRQIRLMHEPYHIIREKINNRAAFIYFWMDDFTMQQHRDSLFSYFQPVDSLVRPGYKVFVFEQKGK